MTAIRKGLLSGNLDNDCIQCRAKGVISINELKKRIPHPFYLQLKNLGFRYFGRLI